MMILLQCAKIDMPLLTLARFILEYSLMDYSTVTYSDSKMAAAALLLAIIMKQGGSWTPTLEYYSGFYMNFSLILSPTKFSIDIVYILIYTISINLKEKNIILESGKIFSFIYSFQ